MVQRMVENEWVSKSEKEKLRGKVSQQSTADASNVSVRENQKISSASFSFL